MSAISFDREAHRYDDTRGYPPAAAAAIGQALFQLAGGRPGVRVLEIGVGTGRLAIPLALAGADVTGIDISPRMLDRLNTKWAEALTSAATAPRGTLLVEQGDITALPYAADTFDAVLAVHILHLVASWRRALDEALRVLRPAGALLLGQDRRPGTPLTQMQQRWEDIVRELGYDMRRPGAQLDVVVDELRARGFDVEITVPVTWTTYRSPRWLFDQCATRSSSATWDIPEDIFAAALVRLEAWARERFAGDLDQPQEERAEFHVARAARPAADPGG